MRTGIPVRVAVTGLWLVAAAGMAADAQALAEGRTIRELLWVWGNAEMAEPGPHGLGAFAQASPAERAQL
ncbi:MAG TPA: hypothetical protein PK166_15070, partial [Candidatus Hydrogenedentes bacterium]|nr:hypothetical protein [Candidatus Hydrogenedentota bacterium]